ncbi:MAG: hypothetical protein HY608_02810 [Planctomycetes bacterium]|nr:hypothetical protein [Planctomycetota bacterium]
MASTLLSLFAPACAFGMALEGVLLPRRETPAPFLAFLDLMSVCALALAAFVAGLAGGVLAWGWAAAAVAFLSARALTLAGRPLSFEVRLGGVFLLLGAEVERHLRAGGGTDGALATHLAGWALLGGLGGSVFATMLLGHWYLNVPGLAFGPLRRGVALLLGAVSLRCAWTGAWLALGGAAFPGSSPVLVWTRLAIGLGVPAVMMWCAWGCVRLRANQSATGILYAATALVWIGEMIASHLFLAGASATL